jgi:endogenous inhibitor of DNA gyrase (YacG/DUF329 family)
MSDLSKKCPICDKPPHNRFAPFCSGRCADLDLGKWLKGRYAIPGAPDEADSDDPAVRQPPEEE